MLPTYPALLRDNRLEWTGDAPVNLPKEQGIAVHVTVLDGAPDPQPAVNQGQQLAAILERLAALRPFADMPDPAAWERDIRQDRPLPGRE